MNPADVRLLILIVCALAFAASSTLIVAAVAVSPPWVRLVRIVYALALGGMSAAAFVIVWLIK